MTHKQKAYLEVLAYTFLQNAKYEKALILYLTLKRLYPEEAQYPLARAYIYIQMGEYQAAKEEALVAERLSKTPSKLYFSRLLRSKSLWHLGEEKESQKLLIDFLAEQRRSSIKPLKAETSLVGGRL